MSGYPTLQRSSPETQAALHSQLHHVKMACNLRLRRFFDAFGRTESDGAGHLAVEVPELGIR